jgi:hypothetical protein
MGQADSPTEVLGLLPTHAHLSFHLSTATAAFSKQMKYRLLMFCVRFIGVYLNVLMDYKLRFSCYYDFCKYRHSLFVKCFIQDLQIFKTVLGLKLFFCGACHCLILKVF